MKLGESIRNILSRRSLKAVEEAEAVASEAVEEVVESVDEKVDEAEATVEAVIEKAEEEVVEAVEETIETAEEVVDAKEQAVIEATSPVVNDVDVIKAGTLSKQPRCTENTSFLIKRARSSLKLDVKYQPRHFELNTDYFFFAGSEGEEATASWKSDAIYSAELLDDESTEFDVLFGKDAGEYKMRLKAASNEEASEWVQVLNKFATATEKHPALLKIVSVEEESVEDSAGEATAEEGTTEVPATSDVVLEDIQEETAVAADESSDAVQLVKAATDAMVDNQACGWFLNLFSFCRTDEDAH